MKFFGLKIQSMIIKLMICLLVLIAGCSHYHAVIEDQEDKEYEFYENIYRINKIALKKECTLVLKGITFEARTIYVSTDSTQFILKKPIEIFQESPFYNIHMKNDVTGVISNDQIQEIRFKSISKGAAEGFWSGLGLGILIGPALALGSENTHDEDPAPDEIISAAGIVAFGTLGAISGTGIGGFKKSKDIYTFSSAVSLMRFDDMHDLIEEDRQCRERIHVYKKEQRATIYFKSGCKERVTGVCIVGDSTSWYPMIETRGSVSEASVHLNMVKLPNSDIQQIVIQRGRPGIFKTWTWTGAGVGIFISTLPFIFDKIALFGAFTAAGLFIDMLNLGNWRSNESYQYFSSGNKTFICNFDN